jgi:hypothetical protein
VIPISEFANKEPAAEQPVLNEKEIASA